MTELLTAAQMRNLEQAAIDSGEVTGLELMERAGQGVVEAIFEEWPDFAKTPHRAVVLCGPGNNGGDGFVVARLLKEAGWEVEVFLYGDPDKLPRDARLNYERWQKLGNIRVADYDTIKQYAPFDLRVDAVFGAGLRRVLNNSLMAAFEASRAVKKEEKTYVPPKRVAIDGPSCLDLNSGKLMIPDNIWEGDVNLDFYADLTVSFHRLKIGHVLGNGGFYCGKLKVIDLGLEPGSVEYDWVSEERLNPDRVSLLDLTECCETAYVWPAGKLWKGDRTHKYTHGHALILSGGPGKGGAARLAARGALRIGAGVVTLGCPPAALQENAAQLNAIMLRSLKSGEALTEALEDSRINALCIGPGLGTSEERRSLVEAGLRSARPTVLDADALTLLARNARLLAALHPSCVLTPHAGEFARLFPDIAEKLDAPASTGPAYSKVDATRDAAARAGCVVLFKGPDTVIADPKGRAAISSAQYDRAAPWLATAGSGDVLAGFITGLLARGFDPMQAAETAAWLHVECALKFGPGLIAEDLPEILPQVFRDLGL